MSGLPWKIDSCSQHEEKHMDLRQANSDLLVACMSDISKDDMDYIVRACNAFPDLLAACERFVYYAPLDLMLHHCQDCKYFEEDNPDIDVDTCGKCLLSRDLAAAQAAISKASE